MFVYLGFLVLIIFAVLLAGLIIPIFGHYRSWRIYRKFVIDGFFFNRIIRFYLMGCLKFMVGAVITLLSLLNL